MFFLFGAIYPPFKMLNSTPVFQFVDEKISSLASNLIKMSKYKQNLFIKSIIYKEEKYYNGNEDIDYYHKEKDDHDDTTENSGEIIIQNIIKNGIYLNIEQIGFIFDDQIKIDYQILNTIAWCIFSSIKNFRNINQERWNNNKFIENIMFFETFSPTPIPIPTFVSISTPTVETKFQIYGCVKTRYYYYAYLYQQWFRFIYNPDNTNTNISNISYIITLEYKEWNKNKFGFILNTPVNIHNFCCEIIKKFPFPFKPSKTIIDLSDINTNLSVMTKLTDNLETRINANGWIIEFSNLHKAMLSLPPNIWDTILELNLSNNHLDYPSDLGLFDLLTRKCENSNFCKNIKKIDFSGNICLVLKPFFNWVVNMIIKCPNLYIHVGPAQIFTIQDFNIDKENAKRIIIIAKSNY